MAQWRLLFWDDPRDETPIFTPWQNNMDKNKYKKNVLSMLIEGCFWCGMVQVNLKNHDLGNFRD